MDNPWNDLLSLWISIDDKQPNVSNISLIYGGGTNSIALYLKEIKNISFNDFKAQEIDGAFYKRKYSDYKVFELPKDGVLNRAGADYIFMGVGNDVDLVFPNIVNFSSVMYLYSVEKKRKKLLFEFSFFIISMTDNYKIIAFRNIFFYSFLKISIKS